MSLRSERHLPELPSPNITEQVLAHSKTTVEPHEGNFNRYLKAAKLRFSILIDPVRSIRSDRSRSYDEEGRTE